MSYRKTLAAVAAAAALAPIGAQAAYIYTPGAEYATQDGNYNNGVLNRYTSEKQWFFNASLFGNDAMVINGMSFRFDEQVSNRDFDAFYIYLNSTFNMRLATQSVAPSTTFADNLAGAVSVMSGEQNFLWAVDKPEGETKSFTIHFNFTTPYFYDPRQGNLIVDIFQPPTYPNIAWDFVADTDAGFRLHSLKANPTGQFQPFLPVARFDVTYATLPPGSGTTIGGGGGSGGGPSGPGTTAPTYPSIDGPSFAAPIMAPGAVPEPGAWMLMLLGFGGMGAMLRRRSARQTMGSTLGIQLG